MPNRIIKEGICISEQINELTPFAEITFYRLMVTVDDYGRMDGRLPILKARMYPLKDIRIKQLEEALQELSSKELVELYEVDSKPFVRLTGWERHQKPRASESKFPAPPESNGYHLQADDINFKHAQSDAPVFDIRNSISDIREEKEKRQRFSPPSADEVREYCEGRGNRIDAQSFVDFYASKGWLVGKSPMKDWKAAVRTWETRKKADSSQAKAYSPAKRVVEQQYSQRYYDPAEYDGPSAEEIEEARKL